MFLIFFQVFLWRPELQRAAERLLFNTSTRLPNPTLATLNTSSLLQQSHSAYVLETESQGDVVQVDNGQVEAFSNPIGVLAPRIQVSDNMIQLDDFQWVNYLQHQVCLYF